MLLVCKEDLYGKVDDWSQLIGVEFDVVVVVEFFIVLCECDVVILERKQFVVFLIFYVKYVVFF